MRLGFLVAFVLASCATTNVLYEKCVSAADVPAVPKSHVSKTGTVDQMAAGASATIQEQDNYIRKADALLKACTAKPKE